MEDMEAVATSHVLSCALHCDRKSHTLRTQRAQRSKKFDLARNFQSRSKFLISLENFNLDVSISPQKIGPRWVARSKISFSIEIFNLDRNLEFFWSLGPLEIRTIVKPLWQLPPSEAKNPPIRSRPGNPNQRKGQNEKFMNFGHFCEFWCFSLGKQARFTLNFCSGTPLRKVHELTFFGLVCRGHSWSNISRTKNVALKLPKISLTKGYFWQFKGYLGQFKGYIFAVLGHFCFLLRLGGCGSQGLYNRSSLRIFWGYFLAFIFFFYFLRLFLKTLQKYPLKQA